MKRLFRLALVALAAGCSSSPDAPPDGEQGYPVASDIKLPPLGGGGFEMGLTTLASANELQTAQLTRKVGDLKYFAWHLEFDSVENCAAYRVPGTHVVARHQKWLTVLVPERSFIHDLVYNSDGFVWADMEPNAIVPPPKPLGLAASRAAAEPTVRGGLSGFKGKGTMIAIIDTGIDYRHPDFITPDAQGRPVSRIAWFWDTTSQNHQKGIGAPGPVTYPNGVGLGTVYTRDQLTEELRSSQKRIGPTDSQGHGTSCAGIAAGNGMAYGDRRYAGVAPEADLIGVRVGLEESLPNSYLLGAICTWIDAIAGKKPVVLSCSFGGQFGGRDGSNALERQIDARFPSTLRGRAIVIAAGNEGGDRVHAEAGFSSWDKRGRIEWTVPEGIEASTLLWFNANDPKDIRWASVGKDKIDPATHQSAVHPITDQAILLLKTKPGAYAIDLWSRSGKALFADAYIGRAAGKEPDPYFTGTSAVARRQVASPGTALQAISVGSYDFNHEMFVDGRTIMVGPKIGGVFVPLPIGAISDYSNPGPRRTGGVMKPDLAAPGRFHPAARVLDLPKKENEWVETSRKYTYFTGTSAATPYCAGIIALLFEKNPSLTVGQVKSILQSKATRDARTGATPNGTWGYGKLDLKAAQAMLAAVPKP
jgi:subtilisin family serine protease